MDKRVLKGWLNKEDLNAEQKKILLKLWDLVLDWSGFDYGAYYRIRDLGLKHGISEATVYKRLKIFQINFPEAYENLKEERERLKRVTGRQGRAFRNALSWEDLREEYGDEADSWILEKF